MTWNPISLLISIVVVLLLIWLIVHLAGAI